MTPRQRRNRASRDRDNLAPAQGVADVEDRDVDGEDFDEEDFDESGLPERTPARPAAPLAELPVPRPVLTAVVMGLVPTVFVWLGGWLGNYAATHGTRGTSSLYASTLLVAATCVAMAALAAVFFMARMNDPVARFGLRRPRPWVTLAWLLPLVLIGWLWLGRDGIVHGPSTSDDVAVGTFTAAVTVAQVFWLQGLVQAVLRPRGRRYAVLTTAVLAAVLRFVEGLGSQLIGNPRQVNLAMPSLLVTTAYVLLMSLVTGCLVEITGSLWTSLAARLAIEAAVTYGLMVGVDEGRLQGLGVLVVLAAWAAAMYLRLPPDPVPGAGDEDSDVVTAGEAIQR